MADEDVHVLVAGEAVLVAGEAALVSVAGHPLLLYEGLALSKGGTTLCPPFLLPNRFTLISKPEITVIKYTVHWLDVFRLRLADNTYLCA